MATMRGSLGLAPVTTAGELQETASVGRKCCSYREKFDPAAFLRQEFLSPDYLRWRRDIPLRKFHDFFKDCSAGMKVLDYGCGPTLAYSISSAARASEIVFAEYAVQNRRALQRWMDRDPQAFDWSPYFDYVVKNLEGGTEDEAREREERMRRVNTIVPCDITQDHVIEPGYEGPYDVVVTVFCLLTACENLEEYVKAVKKLMSLLKPGGNIVIYTVTRTVDMVGKQAIFKVGEEVYLDLCFNAEFLQATLEQTGFCDILMEVFKEIPPQFSQLEGTVFISATKPM